jgi:hypothetical protein
MQVPGVVLPDELGPAVVSAGDLATKYGSIVAAVGVERMKTVETAVGAVGLVDHDDLHRLANVLDHVPHVIE